MIQSIPRNVHSDGDFSFVLDSFYVYAGDKSDRFVQSSCRELGLWESDVTNWMINNIQPGWTCLDIGSNIGYFTELLARLSGPEGQVLAFEPNSRLVSKYFESIKLNDYSSCANIIINEFALGDREEELELIIPDNNLGAANFIDQDYTGPSRRMTSQIRRLDACYDGKIDFIKIDIEGYEEKAWGGFTENAINCPLIIAELGPYHSDRFLGMIEEMYEMTDISGNPVNANFINGVQDFMNTVLRRKSV